MWREHERAADEGGREGGREEGKEDRKRKKKTGKEGRGWTDDDGKRQRKLEGVFLQLPYSSRILQPSVKV